MSLMHVFAVHQSHTAPLRQRKFVILHELVLHRRSLSQVRDYQQCLAWASVVNYGAESQL